MLNKGKVSYGHLGVSPKDITPLQAMAFGVKEGAWVDEEPLAQGPAGKAGIHVGDVITAINGKPVHGELDLRTIVAQTPPFTTVEIALVRDRKPMSLKAGLDEARNQSQSEGARQQEALKSKLGFDVQPLTDRLASNVGASANTLGVVIKSIDPTGVTSDIDKLKEGSVILRINDTNIVSMAAYRTVTESLKSGDQVRITFLTQQGKYLRVVQID